VFPHRHVTSVIMTAVSNRVRGLYGFWPSSRQAPVLATSLFLSATFVVIEAVSVLEVIQ
jgi:hypothetical protein